ncbi:MAG TPA: arginine--tRNA ligase [bacterium]|nr:arginine--tRNA ligase [bacterium]
MKEIKRKIADNISEIIKEFPEEVRKKFDGRIEIARGIKEEFGDFSTNIAFKISTDNYPPSKIAQEIIERLNLDFIERAEFKNGFINFFLKKDVYLSVIKKILKEKENYGKGNENKKVLVEFVSANPTGPLTIAHGRQASFGESLSRILEFAGYSVEKEYYINDCGKQIELLGQSLKARYYQLKGENIEIPEEGYHGDYLIKIAEKIKGDDLSDEFFKNFAVNEILKTIKEDLDIFGVKFDRWVKESSFLNEAEKLIKFFEKKGVVYEKDGCLWFKSKDFGDDKDRVLVKSDGSYTYFLTDILYHKNKIERGYDILINIWGPDHLGYIKRLKAAVEVLGFNPENLKIIIVQLTTLYKGKEKIQMSTRKGQFISLRELIDEIGPDASKFFFIFRKAESHLDFDIGIAKKRDSENPVYYLQYAYVRLKHLLKYSEEKGIKENEIENAEISFLKEKEEIDILKRLSQFPEILEKISSTYEIHLLCEYLLDLSKLFHSYYQRIRIVGQNRKITLARLALTKTLFYVFSNSLYLLNISLPERM